MKPQPDNQKKPSSWDAPEPSPTSNNSILFAMWGIVGVAVAMILATVVWMVQSKRSTVSSAPAVAASTVEPVRVEFDMLKGKWLRPDGGYVLEFKRLLDQNALEAAYFNPNPIHVGKAKLFKERGFLKIFVELQDVNYPGSTYTLIYDKESDQLRGIYYQATQQQEYDIFFTRMDKGL